MNFMMIHFIYIPVSTSCEILIIHVPTGIPIDFSKFRLEFGLIIRTPIRIPIDNQENITFFRNTKKTLVALEQHYWITHCTFFHR